MPIIAHIEKYRLRRICTSHFWGLEVSCTDTIRCGMNRVQCIPSVTHQHQQIHCQLQHTLFPFQRLSADYLQPHSYNFGNFLRRIAAGAITFLYALQPQFRLYIPFLGIARPQPQFPHSCIFERFIYSQDQFTYFLQQNRQTHRGNI